MWFGELNPWSCREQLGNHPKPPNWQTTKQSKPPIGGKLNLFCLEMKSLNETTLFELVSSSGLVELKGAMLLVIMLCLVPCFGVLGPPSFGERF